MQDVVEAPVGIDDSVRGEVLVDNERVGRLNELLLAVNGKFEKDVKVDDVALRIFIATVGSVKREADWAANESVSGDVFDMGVLHNHFGLGLREGKHVPEEFAQQLGVLAQQLIDGSYGGDLYSVFPKLDIGEREPQEDGWGKMKIVFLPPPLSGGSVSIEDHWQEGFLQVHIRPVSYDPFEELRAIEKEFGAELGKHIDPHFKKIRGVSHLLGGKSVRVVMRMLKKMFDINDENMQKIELREHDLNSGEKLESELFNSTYIVSTCLRNIPMSVSAFADFVTKGKFPKLGEIGIPIEIFNLDLN